MFWKVIVSAVFLVVLTPGAALAVQYPPQSSTVAPTSVVPTTRVLVTSSKSRVNQPQPKRQAATGVLAKTGVGDLTTPVRAAVVLMVAGFVLYLFGRNRRSVRAKP